MVINEWPKFFTEKYLHNWPSTYLSFDLEYTGFNAEKDVILEVGHCIVENGRLANRASFLLNWRLVDIVPDDWVKNKLDGMHRNVPGWRIDWQLLQKEGLHPFEVLEFYLELFTKWEARGLPFVAHNGYHSDERMFAGNVSGFLAKDFRFGDNSLFDTGAVYKATYILQHEKLNNKMRQAMLPNEMDTLRSYFGRVNYYPAKGCKWRLQNCVEAYGLQDDANLQYGTYHGAEYDAVATALLMEAYREKVVRDNSGASYCDNPQDLQRAFDLQQSENELKAISKPSNRLKPETATRSRKQRRI